MNKVRRHELKMLKYKQRLKRIGLYSTQTFSNPRGVEKGIHYNLTGFRNSGTPCSCWMCSLPKYSRAEEKRNTIRLLSEVS